jgi:hypothetical protein
LALSRKTIAKLAAAEIGGKIPSEARRRAFIGGKIAFLSGRKIKSGHGKPCAMQQIADRIKKPDDIDASALENNVMPIHLALEAERVEGHSLRETIFQAYLLRLCPLMMIIAPVTAFEGQHGCRDQSR